MSPPRALSWLGPRAARLAVGVAIAVGVSACGSEGRRVLIAIDLSTSMRCPVNTTSDCGEEDTRDPPKLERPAEAADKRIGAAVGVVKLVTSPDTKPRWFPPGSTLGIWTFAHKEIRDLINDATYASTSKGPRPNGDFPAYHPGSYGAYLDPLLLSANGNTPLYLAIYHGVRALRASWKPGLNVLVVLSDGKDRASKLDGRRLYVPRLHRALGVDPEHEVHVIVTTASKDTPCPKLSAPRAAFEYDRGKDCLKVDDKTDIVGALAQTRDRLYEIERGG